MPPEALTSSYIDLKLIWCENEPLTLLVKRNFRTFGQKLGFFD